MVSSINFGLKSNQAIVHKWLLYSCNNSQSMFRFLLLGI